MPSHSDAFWKEFFQGYELTADEKKAFRKEIPMTQSLFDAIITKLNEAGMEEYALQFCQNHSGFLQTCTERILEELREKLPLPEDDPELSDEECQSSFQKFMMRIK